MKKPIKSKKFYVLPDGTLTQDFSAVLAFDSK